MLIITEFCLQSESTLVPFATLVERESECHWGIATSGITSLGWSEHVAESKGRRASDSWVFESWIQWLSYASEITPKERQARIAAISSSSAGVIVRKSKNVDTALTPRVVADSWEKRRLHNRSESIAACVARRLSSNQSPHWLSSVQIGDNEPIQGEWIVENQPAPGSLEIRYEFSSQSKGTVGFQPSPSLIKTGAYGIAVIKIIDACEVAEVISQWENQKAQLGVHYPYGVAVVRSYRGAKVTEAGCVVGDRFVAAQTLAIAATKAAWSGAVTLVSANYEGGELE